jgi:tetratricopeptide (TPR) repeat protein
VPSQHTLDIVLADCRALLAAGKAAEAGLRLTEAHQREPGNADILTLNSQALLSIGRQEEAVGALFMALRLQPGRAEAHARLVEPLFALGDLEAALQQGTKAFRLDGSSRHACMVSGVLAQLCRYGEALAFADHAVSLSPSEAPPRNRRAIALDGLGRYDEAVATGYSAIAASPSDASSRFNQGERLLRLGRMDAEAWGLYESRITLNGYVKSECLTVWDGEDITGRTILLHAEQGFGDTLQFVRYAPLLASRAARVILVVQAPLVRLLQKLPGVHEVVVEGSALPPFDVVCPLLSLPRILATTLETVPAAIPYAVAPEPWTDDAAGLRVGLVWAGNPGFANDRHRSLDPAALAVLAGLPGVQFYALQRHVGVPVPLPEALHAIDLMFGVDDFAETAGLIAGLDLVICVDTAVAHLAATMGKPVWLLSRYRGCWRWLTVGNASAWYPTLTIYRQEQPGCWEQTLHRVRSDLAALAATPVTRSPGGTRRPASPPPRPCKLCDTPALPIGAVDFNKSCEGALLLPPSGRRVTYHRCPSCALVFTGDFDHWSPDEFRHHIYNADYASVDPDYAVVRPAGSAAFIGSMLGAASRGMEVLDYGGGNGALAGLLCRDHGMRAVSYDPFDPASQGLPARRFPFVTCFEVLEHSPDPRATIRAIADLVEEGGFVLFSTLVQPADFDRQGMDWWYLAPRNGHVTLFSAQSLKAVWAEVGFGVASLTDNIHRAKRM